MIKPIHQWELPTFQLEDGLREWWVDPFFATFFFAFWINVYWYFERHSGTSQRKITFESILKFDDLAASGTVYWIGILIFKMMVAPPGANSNQTMPDGIPNSFTSCLYLVFEVITGIVLYDFIFFFVHWGMHELPIHKLRKIHHRHHQLTRVIFPNTSKSFPSKTTTHSQKLCEARHVLRHSFIDGTLQVLVNIIVQRHNIWGYHILGLHNASFGWVTNYSIKSRLARFLHNVLVTWMLTESHTSSPYPKIFRNAFVGVREHRNHHLHHHDYKSGIRYQQFFGYLDNWRFWWITCKKTKTF